MSIPRLQKIGDLLSIKGLHWLVLAVSLIATLAVWQLSLNSARERTRAKFELHAEYAINLFELQMNRYADMLSTGVGFVAGSEEVRPDEWHQFTQRMELSEQFPAIGGIGVLYRVETGNLEEFVEKQRVARPEFTIRPPVDLVSPESPQYVMPLTLIAPKRLEENVAGLDLAREARRRDAIKRAITTGKVQITAPLRPDSIDEAGFVMIAPIFKTPRLATEATRRTEFIGAVVAPLITRNLADGVLKGGIRQVAFRVSDDSETMYDELVPENKDADPLPLLTSSRTLTFFGRDWHFEMHSTKAFRHEQSNPLSTLILIGGLTIDALLLLLFLYMSRANRRAIEFGNTISAKYERQSADLRLSNMALEDRNGQLESFSCVVSHDLRSPLRGIGFLADCIEEDLAAHPSDVILPKSFAEYVSEIKNQVTLAQSLITGILQYSGLGTEEQRLEEVNVRELLHGLRITLMVEKAQLKLIGDFPTFDTYQTELTQVFMNLMGNGYKYHDGQGLAVVTVSNEQSPLSNYYRFAVSDNGPGIEPDYHEKIFEPFSTLQPKDHSMSSGVGLAIVRKLVVQHGGNIEIESEMGQGTRFSFDWPCTISEKTDTGEPNSVLNVA